eukprot:1141414-Amphidinium_carterae.1
MGQGQRGWLFRRRVNGSPTIFHPVRENAQILTLFESSKCVARDCFLPYCLWFGHFCTDQDCTQPHSCKAKQYGVLHED